MQPDKHGNSSAEKLFGHKYRTTLPSLKQNLWDKKNIPVSQNNHPRPYDILNEEGNILARNCHHLAPTTGRFNIKHNYGIIMPISNTSAHLNFMSDK